MEEIWLQCVLEASRMFRQRPRSRGQLFTWRVVGGGSPRQQMALVPAQLAGAAILSPGPRPASPRVSEMKFGLFLFVPPSGFVGRGGWWWGRRGQSVFKVLGTSYKNIRKLFLCNYRTERFGSNPQPGVKTPKTKSGLLAPLRLPPRPRPVTPGSFGTPWPLAVGTPEPLGSSSVRGVGF